MTDDVYDRPFNRSMDKTAISRPNRFHSSLSVTDSIEFELTRNNKNKNGKEKKTIANFQSNFASFASIASFAFSGDFMWMNAVRDADGPLLWKFLFTFIYVLCLFRIVKSFGFVVYVF